MGQMREKAFDVARDWPESYTCLNHSSYRDGDCELRAIHWEHRSAIRGWRNRQINVLRQVEPLSVADQDTYFASMVRPQLDELQPEQILFSYWASGTLIGYGGLVHIAWRNRRGEVSFLVDPDRVASGDYAADFTTYLNLIGQVAFDDLGFHKLTTETSVHRVAHMAILESCGFQIEGELVDHQLVDGEYVNSLLHAKIKTELNA